MSKILELLGAFVPDPKKPVRDTASTAIDEVQKTIIPVEDSAASAADEQAQESASVEDTFFDAEETIQVEDNGAPEVEVEENTASGAILVPLTKEIVQPWKCLVKINNVVLATSLRSSEPGFLSMITFRCPVNFRAEIVIRIMADRDMSKEHNPSKLSRHSMFITIPAMFIRDPTFVHMEDKWVPDASSAFFPSGEGFLDVDGAAHLLATLSFLCRKMYVAGAKVPKLATAELDTKVAEIFAAIQMADLSTPATVECLVRHSGDYTLELFKEFARRSLEEVAKDPLKAWIRDSPNAEAFTMGTLVRKSERPLIDIQRAPTVFCDRKAYLIAHVYGTLYDEEFVELITNELQTESYDMSLVEIPNSISQHHPDLDDADTYESHARAYIAFVDFSNMEVVRPDIGTTIRVTLLLNRDVPNSEELAKRLERTKSHEDSEKELGSEDKDAVFDDAESESENPLCWDGFVIDQTEATPPGCVTVVLERRRDPAFRGRRHLSPFVETSVPVVNFRKPKSLDELQQRLISGPKTRVLVSARYDKQGFKDQVRCADTFWRDPSKSRIQEALLSNSLISPLQRVNLRELKGKSTLDVTKSFNKSQLTFFNGLQSTPELTLLHGPFGTGKTKMLLALTIETISNPEIKQQVLYVVDSNAAVDAFASRLEAHLLELGLEKNIYRAHSLRGEKAAVYPYYDKLLRAADRFSNDDPNFAEMSAVAYLSNLANAHRELRVRGDPRRILKNLSIAHAMYQKLADSKLDDDWFPLHRALTQYGMDGFEETTKETRAGIKLGLNYLMAATTRQADVIITTIAAAAKDNLAANFCPVLVLLDDAARVTELKSLIVLAQYKPVGHLWAGDPQQQEPVVRSAGREQDAVPYLNPLQNTTRLSGMTRLLKNGTEYTMLTVQHRCRGEIPKWLSDTFYHGLVINAPISAADHVILEGMRDFVSNELHLRGSRTNRYAKDIQNSRSSKETGGTSSYNTYEVDEIEKDVEIMSTDPRFRDMSVLVLSFHKAQVNKLKKALHTYATSFRKLSFSTVAGCQGLQADVALISLVKTGMDTAFINEPNTLLACLSRGRWLLGIYTSFEIMEMDNRNTNNNLKKLLHNLVNKKHVISAFA